MPGYLHVEVPVVGPFMDGGKAPSHVREGYFSRVVGADGRFLGCIRPFPGMERLKHLGDVAGTIENLSFCEYACIQKGTTDDVMRGFVVRHGSVADQDVEFVYYDVGAAAWGTHVVYTGESIASTDGMSIATNGKYLYVAVDGQSPQTVWYDSGAAAWKSVEMGPVFESLDAYDDSGTYITGASTVCSDDDGTDTEGLLDDAGEYRIAYRLTDTTRYTKSPLSDVNYYTLGAGQSGILVDMPVTRIQDGGAVPTDAYNTIEVFRSLSHSLESDPFAGGYLYRATTRSIPDDVNGVTAALTAAANTVAATGIGVGVEVGDVVAHADIGDGEVTAVSDDSLTVTSVTGDNGAAAVTFDTLRIEYGNYDDYTMAQSTVRYDPWVDESGVPPSSGTVVRYAGMTLMGDEARGVRWSATHTNDPENFPSSNWTRQNQEDGPVLRFEVAADALYAFTTNAVYRITKAGTYLNVQRMHEGRGLTSTGGAHVVGKTIIYPSALGLVSLDGASGNIEVLSSVERPYKDDWQNTLDSVYSAMDAYMGASFILNEDAEEAFVLWHTSRAVSMLGGCHFARVCTGVHPTAGGSPRAFFVTEDGIVVFPDDDGSAQGNMLGVSGTVGGYAGASGTTTTLDNATIDGSTSADFDDVDDTPVGAYLYMLSGANEGEYRKISSVTDANTLVVGPTAFGAAIGSGDKFVVAPIPFELVWRPMAPSKSWQPVFERKILDSVYLLAHNFGGGFIGDCAGRPHGEWRFTAKVDGDEEPSDDPQDMADGSVVPSYFNRAGHTVEPIVRAWLAGHDRQRQGATLNAALSFELIGLAYRTPSSDSRNKDG